MDIKSLINKVIASKGILRVPSWWMKKLLTEIIGYIDSGDSANSENIVKVEEDTNSKITTLESNTNSKITTLESNTNNKITTVNNNISTINNNISTIDSTIFEMAKSNILKIIAVRAPDNNNNHYIMIDDQKIYVPRTSKKIFTFNNSFKCSDGWYSNDIELWVGRTDVSGITDM